MLTLMCLLAIGAFVSAILALDGPLSGACPGVPAQHRGTAALSAATLTI